MKYKIVFASLLFLFSYSIRAESQTITSNTVDTLGQKQGMWREFKIPFNVLTERVAIKVPKIKRDYYLLTPDEDRKYFPIIECVGAYKDNRKTGKWTEYFSNGKIKSIVNYKDGIPSGKCQMFWENGVLKMECNISDKAHFPIVIYNSDGTLLRKQMGTKAYVIRAIYED